MDVYLFVTGLLMTSLGMIFTYLWSPNKRRVDYFYQYTLLPLIIIGYILLLYGSGMYAI